MIDLKVMNSVLSQLEEERGIPKEKVMEAVATALATAYKKEYGKRGQIVRAHFDINTGKTDFYQIKTAVDRNDVIMEDDEEAPDETRVRFNPEHHMLIEDARKIKKDIQVDEEIVFPLDPHDDFGRIAAQTAKQVIIQKIREAEKVSVVGEYGIKENTIVNGTVQRIERGNIHLDMGRATGIIPYEEQIPGERYRQGEKIRALLTTVEDNPRGVFLRLSRAHPIFLEKLFALEVPEIVAGTVEIRAIAREAGSRSKVAVFSKDPHIDPVGSMVGQRGVRVSTVMSELGGEKIDIIEWSEDPKLFVADALSPARVESVDINMDTNTAIVEVAEDQQSLAIGKGGQNVRLAAKLTGFRIDIKAIKGAGNSEEAAPEAVLPEEAKEEVTPDTSALEAAVENLEASENPGKEIGEETSVE